MGTLLLMENVIEANSILMVDDSSTDVFIAKQCYKLAGRSEPFATLGDGQSLLDYLTSVDGKSQLPSIILLDLNMPYMDGFEVLRQIRREGYYPSPPPKIIVLTNSNDKADKQRAIELGADGFKTKPSDIKEYVAFFKEIERAS